MFVRFVIEEQHSRSGQPTGIFSATYDLLGDGVLDEATGDEIRTLLAWFDEHLDAPLEQSVQGGSSGTATGARARG